ncbi:LysR family transcriptional regulator [Apibacter raozihei]|uniref:winged helix-turn-helix domain-containing protein n=1 Tax=Apibacter TaxID=1778601 RepID=UPI000FE3A128|nr:MULTISPECIES: LysR family transcriptional regulator [Apibacter]
MENLKIEGHIWLETSAGLKIGKGRALLLEEIDKTGSIAAAARNTNIPYRKAWGMIKELNKGNTQPLVIKSVGGREGGGAVLTHEGKKILAEFKRIDQQFFLFKNSTL